MAIPNTFNPAAWKWTTRALWDLNVLRWRPRLLKNVRLSDRDARIAIALAIAHMIHPSVNGKPFSCSAQFARY